MSTNLTKVDVRLHGKTHSFRIALPVWQAFERMAKEDKWSISQAAEIAQRGHNGTLPEAIEAYVRQHTTVPLYGTREEWCGALVELMRPVFKQRGYPLPAKIRAAIAFTSKGWRGKVRGECWSGEMSADGATEIMVCLRESDAVEILNILTHELAHAVQFHQAKEQGKPISKGGHGKDFQAIAAALDLTGDPKRPGTEKMKCVRGDPAGAWGDWAVEMLGKVGPMPHHAIAEHVAKQKKQTTRMLKLECTDETLVSMSLSGKGCEAVWRMSSSHIADKTHLSCPCCGQKVVNPHFEGDVDEDMEVKDGDEVPMLRRPAGDRKLTRQAASTLPRDDSPARRWNIIGFEVG